VKRPSFFAVNSESLYLSSGVFREADGEGRAQDLLLEQVLLVEEEDDGGVAEPLVVADRVEQLQALLHSVLRARNIFFQDRDDRSLLAQHTKTGKMYQSNKKYSRNARFFLVQHTKTGKNVPNEQKIHQRAIKNSNNIHFKTL
jgi:hypothetical protein